MTTKNNLREDAAALVKAMKEFAITVGEQCPEGHRRDPSSGACLPMGPTDHTAFTRSLNDDQGEAWRGLANNEQAEEKEQAIDASEMEEFSSCAAGTVFSFIQKKCVTHEEAEVENNDEFAMISDSEYLTEEVAGGHDMVVDKDPAGRKDPVGFQCPSGQFFDFSRRECIPLNKDSVMASESVDSDFKQALAGLSGRLAVTSPDPVDGHTHLVTVDKDGNGKTSVATCFCDGESFDHSHDVEGYEVKDFTYTESEEGESYTSRHFGYVLPKNMWEHEEEKRHHDMMSTSPSCGSEESPEGKEEVGAVITTKQRKALPSSAFGVPGKRKFPLDTCARVRNAMARFNQGKGLTAAEKATLRRKILAAAKKCGIEVRNFAKAESAEDFTTVTLELLSKERVMKQYSADQQTPAVEPQLAAEDKMEEKDMPMKKKQGPCPPGMEWDPKAKKCGKVKGYYTYIREQAAQSDLVPDPAGRQDTPGFECPPGSFFDFKNRKCLALDPSRKEGTSTSKASEEDAARRALAPSPKGRPARLPQDCPAGTIWNADREDCVPLSADKKTKSAEETAGSEGLTPAPAGKVKLPSDCPAGTMWDGVSKTCTPMDSRDKSRPGSAGPQSPKSFAEMSTAKVISVLDEIIKAQGGTQKEKSRVIARDLPNEAFPPSLVGSTRRNLMHHTPEVTDAYDNASVDVARLRNALARIDKLEGYSPQAIADARAHLLFHAQEVVESHLGKN